MGCASSKQARRDPSPIAPLPRSYSLPIHHPAQCKGDSYHVVALTSTTLGTIKLDPLDEKPNSIIDDEKETKPKVKESINGYENKENPNLDHCFGFDLTKEVVDAKAWSNKMEGKISHIPKTPNQTPPNEPETINAWELMEGLEDSSPLRSFSFHAYSDHPVRNPPKTAPEPPMLENGSASPKPVWLQSIATDTIFSDFDPETISNFRKALNELSPRNPFWLKSPEPEKTSSTGPNLGSTVQERIRAFQERINEGRLSKKAPNNVVANKCPPRGEDSVVLYFTSLRGVRKTYEDCCRVRLIFKGFGVRTDERDVSLHQGFREELAEILGVGFGALPRVFVNGMYLGGEEEVRQMHDSGELEKVLEGSMRVDEGGGGACEGCGDVRFVPCDTCCGSCKIFDEDEEVFLRCPDCNENGLIRCPVCSI